MSFRYSHQHLDWISRNTYSPPPCLCSNCARECAARYHCSVMMRFSYSAKFIVSLLLRICWHLTYLKKVRILYMSVLLFEWNFFAVYLVREPKSRRNMALCLFYSVRRSARLLYRHWFKKYPKRCGMSVVLSGAALIKTNVRLEGSKMWRVISMFVLLFELLCTTFLSS
jgi:hypothetical protein